MVAEIPLGVGGPFHPEEKAHPAFVVDTWTEFEAMAERIQGAGHQLSWAERDTFEGYLRFYAHDPFGNRLEVMTAR